MKTELLFGTESERDQLVAQVAERTDETTEDHLPVISTIITFCTLTIAMHC